MKFIAFCFAIFTMLSCQNRRQASVLYVNGDIERPADLTLEEMQKASHYMDYTDTIYISDSFFDLINRTMNTKKVATRESVDSRILIEMEEVCFSLGMFNYATIQSNTGCSTYKLDDRSCYELRKAIQYYNRWGTETLEYCDDIEKYGIPENYKYIDTGMPDNFYTKILILEDKSFFKI